MAHMKVTDKQMQIQFCPYQEPEFFLWYQCFSKYELRPTSSKSPEMLVKNKGLEHEGGSVG